MQADNRNDEPQPLLQVQMVASPTSCLYGIRNFVTVLAKIITGHLEDTDNNKRPPLNLAIVLDRSGSMRGEKLENAKKAIIKVIENLGEDDILHLVLYGSDVEVLFENADMRTKDLLINKVKAVSTSGMTNLWGGLEKGSELVDQHKKAGYTQRVFLFSDGLVNVGVTNKEEIYNKVADTIYTAKGTRVSAFGLGNDFDEELMKSISEYGNGSYFFISSSKAIPEFVNLALKGLLKLVGSDTVLKLRGVNGGVVKGIYGREDEALVSGVRLDDLRQDNTRMVVFTMEVTPPRPPQDADEAEKVQEEILRYELTYKDASTAQAVMQGKVETKEGGLSVRFTHDGESVEKSQNPEVRVAEVVQQTGEIDKALIKLIDQGNKAEAEAELQKQIDLLKSVEDLDSTGMVSGLLAQAQKSLEDMRRDGLTAKTRKEAHHRGYMKRRNSACYFQGYVEIEQ